MDNELFLKNQEYLLRLRLWADRRIRALGQSEENHTKGMGIAALDGKRAMDTLNIRDSSYDMTSDDELCKLLEDMNQGEGKTNSRLGCLAAMFRLNALEQLCLFLSVLPDIDGAYGKVFSWLGGAPAKSRPTLEVVANLMGLNQLFKGRFREELEKGSGLSHYMLEWEWQHSEEPFWSRELRPDSRITGYILGIDTGAKELYQVSLRLDKDSSVELEEESPHLPSILHAFNCCAAEASPDKKRAVYVYGEKGCGKKEVIKQLSRALNRKILILQLDKTEDKLSYYCRQAVREAILTGSILGAESYQSLDEEKQNQFWREMQGNLEPLLLLSTEKPGRYQNGRPEMLPLHIPNPSFEERKQIWNHYLKPYEIPLSEQERLASKFLFLPGQIQDAVRFYENCLKVQKEEAPSLYGACFAQISHQLYERATKITTGYSWDQLILPESQKKLLHDICAQMENKYTVYEKWGFGKTVAYGKGVTVIFAGPPGTGKTMAAQILSKELNLELFKIDLSQMVSKYVGETEKNLASVFHEAEISNAILFFDEADSLFGARTEVKSSNDRYANLETSYLLQRLEEYEGMTVLATNYLKNIDEAFMRRMKYIIQFQFPDAATRQRIWRVTMPDAAPVSSDLDYEFLGENLELAGGSIKNIVVYAAFMAADRHCEIGMGEILRAARYEMQKAGKILLGKDLKHYGYLLEES